VNSVFDLSSLFSNLDQFLCADQYKSVFSQFEEDHVWTTLIFFDNCKYCMSNVCVMLLRFCQAIILHLTQRLAGPIFQALSIVANSVTC
jgi:hypothetical protein